MSKWHRRDAKKNARKRFRSDNRESVRGIQTLIISKAVEIRKAKAMKLNE